MAGAVGRLERMKEVVTWQVVVELLKDHFLKKFENEQKIRDRATFFRSFGSRLFFFWRVRTIAVLNAVGKEPVCKGVLTMSVMAGSRYGRQSKKLCTLLFTSMPGESYTKVTKVFVVSDVFWAPINSLVCWFCAGTLHLILFKSVTIFSHANMIMFICFHIVSGELSLSVASSLLSFSLFAYLYLDLLCS